MSTTSHAFDATRRKQRLGRPKRSAHSAMMKAANVWHSYGVSLNPAAKISRAKRLWLKSRQATVGRRES
jgi:hypothetical protein